MEDKPEGDGQEKTGAGDTPQGPPPPLSNEKKAGESSQDPKEGRAESSAQEPQKSKIERFKNWVWPMEFSNAVMIMLTGFIALGTIVSAIAIGFQWREMHKGGKDTENLVGYAKQQACSARKSAKAAGRFAESAGNINTEIGVAEGDFQQMAQNSAHSIKATQDAMRQDQRAWLGTSDNTYTIVESGSISSSVTVLNTGKSPAVDIICRITGITKPKGYVLRDSDIVYPPELPTLKEGTIFPNQHFPLTAGGIPMEPDKQKIWFDKVQSGEWVQYFFGDVRYKDTFGVAHWTHFCSKFVPATKAGTPCPIYTNTDDTKSR